VARIKLLIRTTTSAFDRAVDRHVDDGACHVPSFCGVSKSQLPLFNWQLLVQAFGQFVQYVGKGDNWHSNSRHDGVPPDL